MGKKYNKELINQIPLIEVIQKLGIEYKKKGSKIYFLCPGHNDSTVNGNCRIFSEITNTWCCHVCGAGGDVINLAQHYWKVDFPTALKRLSEIFGIDKISQDECEVYTAFLTEEEYETLSCGTKKVQYILNETELRLYKTTEKLGISMRDLFKDDPELHDELLLQGFYKSIKYYGMASFLLDESLRGEVFSGSLETLKKLLKKGLSRKSLYNTVEQKKTPA